MTSVARLVGGRYQLVAHLGGGATSDVSLAKTTSKQAAPTLAVLKRLKLGADAEPEVLALFSDEANLCVRLDHPNIVKAIAAHEDDAEGPTLVLEYVESQTLGRIGSRARRRGGGVPLPIALHIIKDAARGLAYAHALADEAGKPLKVVHRDVTPENILVTYDGVAKLIDFRGVMPSAYQGAVKESIAYFAPEQVQNLRVDARVDVFALGLVLWELLAGKRIWEGLSEAAVKARLTDSEPMPTLRSVVPDAPAELDAICTQALAKIRDDRFDSAVEMVEALEKATKAPELKTTAKEVGEFVASLFEDDRTKMRTLVEEALARPSDAAVVVPKIAAPSMVPSQFGDVESNPSVAAAAASMAPPVRVVEVLRVEQAPSRDRRFGYVVAGAVLIAFAGVAAIALTSKSTPETPVTKPEPRPRPTVSTAQPATSAEAEPEEVTVEIMVSPPKANLFVDGVKTALLPYRTKVVRGKFAHQVRAEADGFETRTMTVAFDRDRSIDIVLKPKTGGPGGGPGPGPSPAPRPSGATPAPPRPLDLPKPSEGNP